MALTDGERDILRELNEAPTGWCLVCDDEVCHLEDGEFHTEEEVYQAECRAEEDQAEFIWNIAMGRP